MKLDSPLYYFKLDFMIIDGVTMVDHHDMTAGGVSVTMIAIKLDYLSQQHRTSLEYALKCVVTFVI